MKLDDSKVYALLLVASIFFAFPPQLHSANFKIEPLVLPGDPAPDGGTFLQLEGNPVLNPRGDIVFAALSSISSSTGLYLIGETTSQLLLRSGEIANVQPLVSPASLGIVQVSCPFPPEFCALPPNPSLDFFRLPNGDLITCDRNERNERFFLSLLQYRINDSHELLLLNTFVSGGSVKTLDRCPIREFFFSLDGAPLFVPPIGITNSGTLAMRTRGLILLIKGGAVNIIDLRGAPAPTGGTIQFIRDPVMNNNEDLLVPFRTSVGFFVPQGFVLLPGGSTAPVPVVFTGSDAPGGRKFTWFGRFALSGGVAMNDKGQVVFSAALDDVSIGIFRRDPDETIKVLFEDRPSFGKIIDFSDVSSMDINEKGEVAAVVTSRDFNSRRTGDLLFFDSEGIPSKIVSLNDPAPGGGNFLDVGSPRLNNKGEIIFVAVLSDGKIGIFKASKGLETEFVDPVPDLLAGPTVTSDTAMLAKNGRVVTGIAADGAARVVVRVKTGQAETVDFSLVDENGAVLPPSNFNGFLSQVSEDMGSGAVSVPSVDVEGFGHMAFAAYHAPDDYARNPTSGEAGERDRKAFIRIRLRTSTGETSESTESLRIVRPPVVLVHGIWDSLTAWNTFTPLVDNPNFVVGRANYDFAITGTTASTPEYSPGILATARTNTLGFTFNASFVLAQIIRFVDDFKSSQEVAAIQADIVAHSMGGNVARNLPLIGGFFSDKTFDQGIIHKIVTIGTPHLGTPLATEFLKNANSCVRELLADRGHIAFRSLTFQGRTFDGGVFELEGDGVGGQLSLALRRLQQPGPHPLPTAMIAGVMSQTQLNGLGRLFGPATGIKFFCAGDPLADNLTPEKWPSVFGEDSDAIVPLTSQVNGLQGSTFTAVHSSGAVSLGFHPPHELEEATNIPAEVIKLLNTPVTSGSFHLLTP